MTSPVYKFMSGEDYHLESLRDNQVYFSSVNELNDPYEGLMHYCNNNVTDSQRMAALTQEFKQDHSRIQDARKEAERFRKELGDKEFNKRLDFLCKEKCEKYIQKHRDNRFVLSLSAPILSSSTDKFPLPLNNMLMWAHYGKGMKGFCVEYDFNTLRNSINKLNNVVVGSQSITYASSKLPIIKYTTLLNDLALNTDQTSEEVTNAFCTKHSVWKYENEIRMISEKHKQNDISEESINRVFVSAQNQKLMIEIINILQEKKHKPELYEVITQEIEYGFGFKKIPY